MTPLLAQGRMRLVGLGLLVATFLVGALAGAAVDRVLSADVPEARRDGRDDDRRRSYVIDRIDMTADQRAAIDAILERRSARMRAVWKETGPRLEAITDSARAEIMGVLTPEQRAQYEQHLRARHDRKEKDGRRDRRDRPGS